MASSCPVCCKNVLDSEEGIQCDSACTRWFHRSCILMNKADYKKYADDTNLKWSCVRNDCIAPGQLPLAVLSNQMTTVIDRLDLLLGKVSKIDSISQDIDGIKSDITSIRDGLSALEPRISATEDNISSMQLDLNSLAAKVSSNETKLNALEGSSAGASSGVVVEVMMEEVHERALRAKNIMLFGLSENSKKNAEDNKKEDKANIVKLLSSAFPGYDSSRIRFFRVGKKSANKTRPIKLILDSEARVPEILKTATREFLDNLGPVFEKVRLARDKTKRELEYLDHLRRELERRTKGGESGLTIKFVNGTPKIVISKNE